MSISLFFDQRINERLAFLVPSFFHLKKKNKKLRFLPSFTDAEFGSRWVKKRILERRVDDAMLPGDIWNLAHGSQGSWAKTRDELVSDS